MGPQGTGGLAVAEGVDVAPWAMGGTGVHSFDALRRSSGPRALRRARSTVTASRDFLPASDFIDARGGVEAIAAHERALADRFLAGVREIPALRSTVRLISPCARRSSHSTWAISIRPRSRMRSCKRVGDCDAPRRPCAPLMHRALGTERPGIVRFSFGYFNTDEEVDTAIDALRDLAC